MVPPPGVALAMPHLAFDGTIVDKTGDRRGSKLEEAGIVGK